MALGNSQPSTQFIFQRELFYPHKQILADDARHRCGDGSFGAGEEKAKGKENMTRLSKPEQCATQFSFRIYFIMKNSFLLKSK